MLRDWLDNPIFVKHVRSRLRAQPLGAAIVVVLVLCICIAWGGYQLDAFQNGGAFGALLALQAVILVVMGASQVGASVGAARASGILDFHRVSPLTPDRADPRLLFRRSDPRIYSLRLHAPVLGRCAWRLVLRVFTHLCELMILLVASAWVFHGLALLNALLGKAQDQQLADGGRRVDLRRFFRRPARGRRPGSVGGRRATRICVCHSMGSRSRGWPSSSCTCPPSCISSTWRRGDDGLGADPSSFQAAVDRRARDRRQCSRSGPSGGRKNTPILEVGTLYLLVITAIFLILMVTPNRAEYLKGLWRARKAGPRHLPWWDDLALNRVFLVIVCAIVLVDCDSRLERGRRTRGLGAALELRISGSFPLAIAAGVLVVAYFGLAHQYFALRFGGRSRIYFGLFLFLAWLVPLVAGMILAMASLSPNSDAEKCERDSCSV